MGKATAQDARSGPAAASLSEASSLDRERTLTSTDPNNDSSWLIVDNDDNNNCDDHRNRKRDIDDDDRHDHRGGGGGGSRDRNGGNATAASALGRESERGFFAFVARHPLPFCIVIPSILSAIAAVGWTREDKVERDVSNLWTPTGTRYHQDKVYQARIDDDESSDRSNPFTIFAAMAIGRDEGNIFTESRLEEIRDRMELLENTTVEHMGHTFAWDDICASNSLGMGTTYKFPCARLTALDYFQESRWSFRESHRLTWYDAIYDEIVEPRLPRYDIVRGLCRAPCNHVIRLRTDAVYAARSGYDESYATPLGLFADVGTLEQSDRCKICVEEVYEEQMVSTTQDVEAVFRSLRDNLRRVSLDPSVADRDPTAEEVEASTNASQLLDVVIKAIPTIDRKAVEDFYRYYSTRSLYGNLGAELYRTTYNTLRSQFGPILSSETMGCSVCSFPENISVEEAEVALLRHADNPFSGVNAGGAPLPLWNPTTGYLLDPEGIGANDTGGRGGAGLGPHGGSGIDLSGGPTDGIPLQSAAHFGVGVGGDGDGSERQDDFVVADPFADVVLYDPIVVWFMAGVTPFTSHCGNDPMPADKKGNPLFAALMETSSPTWCTKHNEPYLVDGNRTKQHFARMWYDLLTNSANFLNITQGTTDPYVWTTGQGCGYNLRGQRASYTNQTESVILRNASMELYYVDEGEKLGVLDRHILIGGTTPDIGDYNQSHPLESAKVIHNIYLAAVPEVIVGKVKNCNRPGGPINNLTVDDAKIVLRLFKKKFEEAWSQGWDDADAGEVQMIGFFDDTGVGGSTARMLEEVTLSGGTLMTISFIIIIVFSVVVLASFDVIESRVLVTFIGVGLVILSFFAAIGLAILIGIKINITIGWTLPFIVVGLGVDDMYIISFALKEQNGYTLMHFNKAMKEVSIPVTMTSLVNFCMFAVMNLSDIPAVYKTAQAAMLCVALLWFTIIVSFPAFCFLDMKRQEAGRVDVFFCLKSNKGKAMITDGPLQHGTIYGKVYKPLIVDEGIVRTATHIFVAIAALALLAVGIYGSINRKVGLGVEDLFSTGNQAGVWALYRTKYIGSWNVKMNWGALDYGDPATQLRMMQQFEGVASSQHVSEIDTDQLWIADFNLWTTRLCRENFVKRNVSQKECGRDFGCVGTWEKNTLDLRLKNMDTKTCQPRKGGVCRRTADMHPEDLDDLSLLGKYDEEFDANASWCPVFDAKTDDDLRSCIEKWRDYASGSGGLSFVPNTATESGTCPGEFYNNDTIVSPIPISSGPLMFAINMHSHEDTINMIKQTRSWCDDRDDTHCWMTGVPFDYWEQYIYIDNTLYQVFGVSIAVGFVVSALFLLAKISSEHVHPFSTAVYGSIGGAFLIIATCVLSTVTVIGLSSMLGVSLTAFSAMAYVLSVGFVVEYSVHIIQRFITAPMEYATARKRVEYSMSFLFLPTFMSFVSSTIGVVCLAFTEFEFNRVYFFKPLMVVMFVTYFFGCFFLPVLLSLTEFEFLKLGHYTREEGQEIKKDARGSGQMQGSNVVPESAGCHVEDEMEATLA